MIFQSPNLLWALSLLAIPIIIHLFQFKRYKQLLFPDVSLLKEIQSRSQTKNQVRHILILISRLFLVAFLVLAFARPFIPAANSDAKTTEKVSIYIDNSFSMQNTGSNGTILADAIQKAYEIAESYPSETDFQLITNNLEPYQKQFSDFDSFIAELDQIEISAAKADGSRILDFYKSTLRDNELNSGILYFLSDFKEVFTSDLSIDSAIELRILPLSGVEIDNLSLDSVWIESPILTRGKQESLFIRIRNYGNTLVQDIPIDIFINDRLSNSLIVTLEAQKTLDTNISLMLNNTGVLNGIIKIKDQPIIYDNNLRFTFPVRDNISVVEINGPKANSSPFFKLFKSQSEVKFFSMPSDNILLDSAASADFIILNEIEEYSTGLFALLNQRLNTGINIYVIPPTNLLEKEKEKWKTEFEIEIGDYDTSKYSITKINLENNLYKAIFEEKPTNLNLPTSGSYYSLKRARNASNVLSFSNEQPFLSEFTRLNGSIYFQASPQTSKGNNFSQHALFVPTIYNAALLSGKNIKINYQVGDSKVELPKVDLSESLEMRSEDSTSFIPSLAYDGLYLGGQINKEGFYTLLNNGINTSTYAFNYTRSESTTATQSIEEIAEFLEAQNIDFKIIQASGDQLKAEIKTADLGQEMWYWAILIALLFVILESVLIKIFNQ